MENSLKPVSGSAGSLKRVLVVEDDLVCKASLRAILQSRGFHFVGVESGEAARDRLSLEGFDTFDCVLTDYWMPGLTGLELLGWIKRRDASLGVVLLTANADRQIIADALHRGATDLLEKTIPVERLIKTIEKAIHQTRRTRSMVRSQRALKDLGRTQMWMVRPETSRPGKPSAKVCFHPQMEAGGDLFDSIESEDGTYCCLLADVSGHDLRAAYISAYFHGVFRGMMARKASLPEIFCYFNGFLVNEWNQPERLRLQNSPGTALAAVGLVFDPNRKTVSILNCGAPFPVYVSPDGLATSLCRHFGAPLGWFPELDCELITNHVVGGGSIYFWTDGLLDLAEAERVHPLCLGYALQQATQQGARHLALESAEDDVLFAAIELPSADGLHQNGIRPLFMEEYRGDQLEDIDRLQEDWRRNLKLALPELGEPQEHDILLALREAVINGMMHGCQGQSDKKLHVQINWNAGQKCLQTLVSDPGKGHQFDFVEHHKNDQSEIPSHHRGLFLMANLASEMKLECNGAKVLLDFYVPEFEI